MFGAFEHWFGARERRIRVDQIRGRIHRAAVFAIVAILVFGAAFRAGAFDEAVRQEHVLLGVEKLLDGAGVDQASFLQIHVYLLGQFVVFRRVGAVPVVKGDVKTVEVGLAASGYVGHKGLRCLAGFLGGDHDRRAVGVVGTDKIHLVPLHPLKPHPDIGLDVLHDVADVEIAVGIRQGGGDEELAGRGHSGIREFRNSEIRKRHQSEPRTRVQDLGLSPVIATKPGKRRRAPAKGATHAYWPHPSGAGPALRESG